MTHVVKVDLAKKGDWFIATSPTLPGFFVAHPNVAEFYEEIPEVIKLFFKATEGIDVDVKIDSPVNRQPLDHMLYVAETKRAA
jgi:hypothetical protein